MSRLQRPVASLIKSVERIGQGDYTRPVEVRPADALGGLEHALERMRGRLRVSTINKSYLHSVLNSMTDAVFVTSPDGVIKIANTASCKLLGYAEEELLGRSILAVLDEREREDFDLLQAAQETRETVVRTRTGQTIPVSFTGSRIDSDDPQFQGSIFVARNITDRKRAERRIRYLARYDALTKIPNRMQFHHVLQQTIARNMRNGQVVAALYLDMDRFKEVNDTFGHGAGRPGAGGAGRTPDALGAQGHRRRAPRRGRVRAVRRGTAGGCGQPRPDRPTGARDPGRGGQAVPAEPA